MSPEALTAERVYHALRADIIRGRFAPSAILNVQAIAQAHDMSISPIRDALHRMVGERLLAARPAGGFEIMSTTVETAADLYKWHAFLLKGAVIAGSAIRFGDDLLRALDRIYPEDSEAIVAITVEFFYLIGEVGGSGEHLLAIRSAGDRLHALRLRESCIGKRREELRGLISLGVSGSSKALRTAIIAYHRRRLRCLSLIVPEYSGPSDSS